MRLTHMLRGVMGLVVLAVALVMPAQASAQGNRACDGLVTVSLTNVRKGPGLEYDIVTTAPRGEKVIAVGLDLTAKWYIVYLPRENNIEARWIFRNNLKITKNCVKALRVQDAGQDAAQ